MTTRHPGDPRSDAEGEQKFDFQEYPGPPPRTPPMPPKPPNALGGTAYRGRTDHGVPFQSAPVDDYPLAAEEAALGEYLRPDVSPRDFVQQEPVRVTVVDPPNLIQQRNIRFNSFRIPVSTSYQCVAGERLLRKRIRVTVTDSAGGAASVYISDSADAIDNTAKFVYTAAGSILALDTEAHSAIYVRVASAAGASTAVIAVEQEEYLYDGEKLL